MTDAAVGEVNPAGSALHWGTLMHVGGNGWARVQLGCSFFLSHRHRRGLRAGLSKAFSSPPWLTLRPPPHTELPPPGGQTSPSRFPMASPTPVRVQSLTVSSKCRTQPRKQRRPGEVAGWLAATRTWLLSQRSRQRPSWRDVVLPYKLEQWQRMLSSRRRDSNRCHSLFLPSPPPVFCRKAFILSLKPAAHFKSARGSISTKDNKILYHCLFTKIENLTSLRLPLTRLL